MIKKLLSKLKLDNKKIAAILVIAFFLAYLDYTFVLGTQWKALSDVNNMISVKKKNLDKLNKDLANLAEVQRKQSQINKAGLTIKIKKLITDGQIPLLLKEISDLANTNQVRIMQIKPEKETKDARGAKVIKAQNLIGVKVTMDLSCDYHRLGKFLNAIENSEVFFEVEEIKIDPVPNDYFRQNVRLILKTYVKD